MVLESPATLTSGSQLHRLAYCGSRASVLAIQLSRDWSAASSNSGGGRQRRELCDLCGGGVSTNPVSADSSALRRTTEIFSGVAGVKETKPGEEHGDPIL